VRGAGNLMYDNAKKESVDKTDNYLPVPKNEKLILRKLAVKEKTHVSWK
jgi:hypothetical protein